MKAWILAAIVAGVLVLVGVPAVALTLGSSGSSGHSSAGPTKDPSEDASDDASEGPHEHPPMWKHGHGWGPPGWAHRHGPGHPPFGLRKLTAKQRQELADRLDQRATQLHEAAACLRQNGDPKTCFKDTFGPRGFSRPQRQG
jgi:hypothetical protein